jgi:BirA family transcriptional regulator, biotin operon repressor / biotin---[acetyl-CoA-carboxylase] ligase
VIAFAEGRIDPDHWKVLENFVSLRSTLSTNALARELIEVSFDEDQNLPTTVLVAEEQTEAYGRGGRSWAAPAGRGLYVTIVRRAPEGEPLSLVPIAVARWTGEVLRERTGAASELKWPNDLYAGGRKLAGVIAESRTQGDATCVAVGIGVNVLGSAAALGVPHATTVQEQTGKTEPLAPLLQSLLDRVDRELAAPRWSEEVRAWERASLHRPGDRLTIWRNGEEVTGQYLGLDPSGFLRLRTETGEAIVATGEVARW